MMRLRAVVIVLFLVSLLINPVFAQSEDDGLIAFAADEDGKRQIYIMNADGSDIEQLTNLDHYPLSPVWSPSGETLAFAVNEYEGYGSGTGKIYTMTASGARLREILEINQGNINNLDWSTDGESLLISVLSLEGPSLYTVDPDGANLEVIIDEQRVWYAKWSPDGDQIYASEYTMDGTIRLFSMNTNGGREREVPDLEPIQSPVDFTEDGEQVLYVMDEDGTASLYIADADFDNPERIIRDEVMPGSHPSWSPDGAYIVFDHIDGGLYTVEIDSGDLNPIYDLGYYSTPAWQPSGEFTSDEDEEVVEADEEDADEEEAAPDLSDYTEVYMVEECEIRARNNVNMRGGPGTNFEQVGILAGGERAFADLQARDGTLLWWRLEDGGWVRWDIVEWEEDCQHLPREGDDPGEVLLVPAAREEAPDDAVLLRDGRGMISDRVLERGEIQIEYFCAQQGLRAYRGKNNWACETGGERVRLEIEDYDLICQQTYWNSFAFAIQDGRNDEPSLNWRCYELR